MLSSNGHKLQYDSMLTESWINQIKRMTEVVEEHIVFNFEIYYGLYNRSGRQEVIRQIKKRVFKLNSFGQNYPSFAIDLFFSMITNNRNLNIRKEILKEDK
tara:strand:- start:347 stop:649 length:303 start_codon:yes stop_codon:yes gene_type:complete